MIYIFLDKIHPLLFRSHNLLYRHPDCDKRPTISDIIQQLQQSDFHILKWIPEDVAEYSKETRTIGSPMKLGAGLYRDLQRTYLVEPEIKQTAD